MRRFITLLFAGLLGLLTATTVSATFAGDGYNRYYWYDGQYLGGGIPRYGLGSYDQLSPRFGAGAYAYQPYYYRGYPYYAGPELRPRYGYDTYSPRYGRGIVSPRYGYGVISPRYGYGFESPRQLYYDYYNW